MPLKLHPPKAGRSPYWRIRGTYLGTYIDQSTRSTDRRFAAQRLKQIREQVERGELRPASGPTWDEAVTSYLQAGGDPRFINKLLDYWKSEPLVNITQAGVDACAATLYPDASFATRNRQVYTPILAVLSHAKATVHIKRPKEGNGKRRTCYLPDSQLFRVLDAAGAIDPELGALFAILAYCGPRLGEALSILCHDVNLTEARALIRDSKNGEPQTLHLPPTVVAALANLPRGLDRQGRVFDQWTTAGTPKQKMAFYALLHSVYGRAGVDPQGAPAHILRHTYATNMKKLGVDLLFTGRWKSRQSSDAYAHVNVSDEARKADMLPVRKAI